ncbi:hypothetical protein BB934_32840 (plasmid) [Microvirga ossetica]|uniref:Chitin-binding type-3 domain-containing protein n=1 Tax=Microvirga ossetica TaxID=1882682 RepID=A0A1B2ET43_9HYPH|nr:carbohydrate-binding protein [Microvirga ossetica]ANY83002.1 hypothetical protein BB934_32840 [Microvirga ossetica]
MTPTKYQRSYSFSGYQATNPRQPLPAPKVDNELENIEQSIGGVIDGLNDVRRSDGKLKNGIVGPEALAAGLSIGFTMRGTWGSGVAYSAGDGVYFDNALYSARQAHTSEVGSTPAIATELWRFLFSLADIVIPDVALSVSAQYPTRAVAAASAIPEAAEAIRLGGYHSAGDGGEASYKKLGAAPSLAKAWHFQSANGAWWELIGTNINIRMFGAIGNGTVTPIDASTATAANDTAAVKAAIDFVSAKGGGYVDIPPGVYCCGTLTLRTKVILRGSGEDVSVLRLRNGTNTSLIKGENADALFAAPTAGGIYSAGLIGLTLDGNWFNNAGGSGVEVFGYSNIFRDVFITMFRDHGLRTEWTQGGPRGGIENLYDNVYIDTVGKYGFWNAGPNDSKLNNVVVLDASQAADHTYEAFLFEKFAPSRLSNCHANNRMYGIVQTHMATNGSLAFRHNIALHDKSGGLHISSSHFEGAWYCNALFKGPDTSVDASCYFYAPWNGKNVIIKGGIVFNGKVSGPASGARRPASKGIQLGDNENGANNVNFAIINSQVNGCDLGAVDFTYCGSGNHVVIRGYAEAGPGKIGTAPAGNSVNMVIGGAGGVTYTA